MKSAINTYGPLALGLALLMSPLGLPIRTGLLVLTAGASMWQGLMLGAIAFGLGLAATLLGDTASYTLGYLAGGRARRLGGRRAAAWQRVQAGFQRHGGPALLLTPILPSELDVPTNQITGTSRYPFGHFLTLLFGSSGAGPNRFVAGRCPSIT